MKVAKAREERLVLERLLDEWIDVLFEREFHSDPHRPGRSSSFAPSFAACISPGPPPVTMSHPMAASAVATRFTSSYTNVPGCARAEPKMATRYRSRFDGLRRVKLLTTFQRSRTVAARISLTASSSPRLTNRVASGDFCSLDIEDVSAFSVIPEELRYGTAIGVGCATAVQPIPYLYSNLIELAASTPSMQERTMPRCWVM